MLLLLHGASRLSLDGYGAHVLPSWVQEEQRLVLLHDLAKIGDSAERRAPLSDSQVATLEGRFRLPLLGGILSSRSPMVRFQTPMPSHTFKWEEVSFRLTLCWIDPPEPEGPVLDVPAPVLNVERFEVGGVSLAGSPHAAIDTPCAFGITLFLETYRPMQQSGTNDPTLIG